jgi:ABC-2 type transport system permease protein
MSWSAVSSITMRMVARETVGMLVFGVFGIGAFFAARFTTFFLLHTLGIGMFLLHRFIAMVLFVLFLSINVGNIVVSFSTMYRSGEVQFLLTTPVPHGTLFAIKFLDNFFYSSGTLFLAGFSLFLGYGAYFQLPWHFHLFMMLGVLVPFMLIAASTAVLMLLGMMAAASRFRFRTIIIAVIVVYALQLYLYFAVTNPVHLANEVMKFYPNVNQYFGYLDAPAVRLLPNFWVSQILYFYTTGDTVAVAQYTALLIGVCVLMCSLMFAAGKQLYYGTWTTSLSLKGSAPADTKLGGVFRLASPSRLPSQAEVLLKREFWQFVRDPAQWIHFVVMVGLVLVFVISVGALEFRLSDPMLKTTVYLSLLAFNVFLIASITLRFLFPQMSLEGKAYWTIRSAPISPVSVYWIKSLLPLLPLLVIGGALVLFSSEPFRAIPFLESANGVAILCSTVTLVSLNLGMGAYFANFGEKNPIRIASSHGATLTFLVGVGYLLFVGISFFFPVYLTLKAVAINASVRPQWMLYVFAVNVVVMVLLSTLAHVIGTRSLRRDF